jgi:molybdenum cofactor guanylyltransferase
MSVDGVVLAGGPGVRLGRPKAGVLVGGVTLVERAVAALAGRCRRVVVVSRPGIALPALPVAVVLDRPGPDCALNALATGLAALDGDDVLVLACDLPFAAPALDALLAAEPGAAVVAAAGTASQPLCARYPREAALAAALRLLGDGALAARGLADALGAAPVQGPPGALLNVNTRRDLARARYHAGG